MTAGECWIYGECLKIRMMVPGAAAPGKQPGKGGVFKDSGSNGAISANDMYHQFTLPSETRSHHITVDA